MASSETFRDVGSMNRDLFLPCLHRKWPGTADSPQAETVDGASLTVMKGASPRQILELVVRVLLDDEEILRETKAPYPDDV